jgi:hypothetical protein
MNDSEREALRNLHRECTAALEKCLREGHEMCRMLSAIESHPISHEQRVALIKQRLKENQAQRAYDYVRTALFNAAGWS